jgi:inhibitor of cysteine peptidase
MKRKLQVLPALVLSAGLLVGADLASAAVKERVVTEKSSGKTVRVAAGSSLRIVLGENPSTGYGWRLTTKPKAKTLRLLSSTYQADAHPVGEVGTGGRHIWRYRAAARGRTSLVITLFPPGRGRPAARAFRLTVQVTGRK